MTTIPDHLIDKAKWAVMDAWCFLPEYIEDVPAGAAEDFAQAALAAVADELRAEAWDEGYDIGYHEGIGKLAEKDVPDNPYRQETTP